MILYRYGFHADFMGGNLKMLEWLDLKSMLLKTIIFIHNTGKITYFIQWQLVYGNIAA